MKPIGPEIRKIRVTQQLTLAEVAKAAKITIKELQAIEKAKEPTKAEIKKVCKVMKIPQETILLFSLESKDIPKEKKGVFRAISPAIKEMIVQLLKSK